MIQALADALAQRGYAALTPVQQAVTQPGLEASDLLVSAQTGSGKTVGFGLAIAPTLLGDGAAFATAQKPLALVIAPTRELALQVKRELGWLYANAGAVVVSCVGGMDMRDERRALERGAHIVVATPGRLRDHIMRGSMPMDALRAVVLDEADEMLDLGFREDLEFILGEAPEDRRTLLFSATVPRAIASLAQSYQKDAVRIVTASEHSQHADIEYLAAQVAERDAENAIINVLRYYEAPNALVFCNTRAMVNRLTTRFSNRGFAVVALSGELTQNERTHALQAMRDGRARVCVATDVAARGIDLPNLELVVHAELPSNAETLLHRSGRTGRAGRKGVSVLIVPPKARRKAENLLRIAKVEAAWGEAPSAEAVAGRDEERLLADPIWSDTATDAERETVQKLMALYGPEQIAAACLRLFNARQSAPEELSPPDTKTPPKPRAAFGPSVWFAVAGGRKSGAEPRRLLPMLCKAGNLTKDDFGAIRVQYDTSYVEIRDISVDRFLAGIGPGMSVEGGAAVTRLDAPPDLANTPRPGSAPRDTRAPARTKPAPADPAPPVQPRAADAKPMDWDDAPAPRAKKPKGAAPYRKPPTPEQTRPEGVVTPLKKPRHKAGKPAHGGAPAVGKPSSKKNRARAKLAAEQKQGSGHARPKRGPKKP